MTFYLLVGAVTLLWGMSFPIAKIGLRGMESFTFLWLRSLFSAITIFALIKWRGGLALPPRGNRDFWINAFLHNLMFLCFYNGIQFTTAGRGALFLYTQPIFYTAMAAYFLPEERIGPRGVVGFAASLGGLVCIFAENLLEKEGGTWLGDGLVILSAFIWGAQALFLKARLKEIDPFRITSWTQLLAILPFFLLAAMKGENLPDLGRWEVHVGAYYNGIVGTGIVMVFYLRLISEYPAGRVSAFMFLCPVFGVILGALLLGEHLSFLMLLGAGLVAAGIYLVNTDKKKYAPREAS